MLREERRDEVGGANLPRRRADSLRQDRFSPGPRVSAADDAVKQHLAVTPATAVERREFDLGRRRKWQPIAADSLRPLRNDTPNGRKCPVAEVRIRGPSFERHDGVSESVERDQRHVCLAIRVRRRHDCDGGDAGAGNSHAARRAMPPPFE